MVDPADIDYQDNWNGGFFELALEMGPRDQPRLQAALEALWSGAAVGGCFVSADHDEPHAKVPVACTIDYLEEHGHLLGVVDIPDGPRIVQGVVLIHETWSGTDWLVFYLPLGALSTADPRVGAYPFDDEGGSVSNAWRSPLEAWLADLGRRAFTVAPFRLGLIGFEISGFTTVEELGGKVPEDRPQTGYLLPTDGILRSFLATS